MCRYSGCLRDFGHGVAGLASAWIIYGITGDSYPVHITPSTQRPNRSGSAASPTAS